MKRLIWLPVAGFLLIAGAAVAAAGSQLLSITPAAVPATSNESGEFLADDLLEDVLADWSGRAS